jgi:hypothetical protein
MVRLLVRLAMAKAVAVCGNHDSDAQGSPRGRHLRVVTAGSSCADSLALEPNRETQHAIVRRCGHRKIEHASRKNARFTARLGLDQAEQPEANVCRKRFRVHEAAEIG